MKVHKTIRYRVHPGTKSKADKLFGQAGACRYVWNHFVGKLRDDYVYYGECNPYFKWTNKKRLIPSTSTVFKWLRDSKPWLKEHSCPYHPRCPAADRDDLQAVLQGQGQFAPVQGQV